MAFLENRPDDPPAYLCIIWRLDDYFLLEPVLFNEDKGDKSIEMMLAQQSLNGGDFVVDSFNVDFLAVPEQGYRAGDLHEVLVDCFVVRAFLFLLIRSEEIRRLHDLESCNSLFEFFLPRLFFFCNRSFGLLL